MIIFLRLSSGCRRWFGRIASRGSSADWRCLRQLNSSGRSRGSGRSLRRRGQTASRWFRRRKGVSPSRRERSVAMADEIGRPRTRAVTTAAIRGLHGLCILLTQYSPNGSGYYLLRDPNIGTIFPGQRASAHPASGIKACVGLPELPSRSERCTRRVTSGTLGHDTVEAVHGSVGPQASVLALAQAGTSTGARLSARWNERRGLDRRDSSGIGRRGSLRHNASYSNAAGF